MKVCLYGAGAMGGYIAALLMRAGGVDVTCIARGPHLAAMQQHGLRLRIDGEEFTTRPFGTDDPAAAGPQDYVIVTLKAHSLPGIAGRLAPLLGPETAVVTALNGIPWWYFHGHDRIPGGPHLDTVDPGGALWRAIGPERAIGCALWPSAEVAEPGLVVHEYGNRMALGEPTDARSARVTALSGILNDAGLRAPVVRDIRAEIWTKLLGNLAFNPLSVVTGETLDQLASGAATRPLVAALMREAQAVAERLGVRIPMSIDKRIDAAVAVGAHKTSMLQDWERGRPLELDALVGSVAELGRRVHQPTPTIDVVYGLVRERTRRAGVAGLG